MRWWPLGYRVTTLRPATGKAAVGPKSASSISILTTDMRQVQIMQWVILLLVLLHILATKALILINRIVNDFSIPNYIFLSYLLIFQLNVLALFLM